MPETEILPYDQGAKAFRNRIVLGLNPYNVGDWQHDEWSKGWLAESDINSDVEYDYLADKFK
ncbi:hypothetical protein A1QO_03850 [Vibrio genomosp. F10 str. ZF-129]|uniref:Uncharacterized protein n=1 Tax=Vibrio genomosp. F10 str. ZF-129 TaxID=1187848 RepID=A0A1E5BIH9_9VIBR|nr:hypothetical protein [Vibrio genomosp. F10]OEE37246.1 hypothetical protein A1QO_03850 [Vibrio genomosp. F10 str. ZF-129]